MESFNELKYVDCKYCNHNELTYCNKCFHRKNFENKNIPYKTFESITNYKHIKDEIKTTYTFILY